MDHTVNCISRLWPLVRQPFLGDTYSSAYALIRGTHSTGSDDVTCEKPNQLAVDTTAVASHIVLQ